MRSPHRSRQHPHPRSDLEVAAFLNRLQRCNELPSTFASADVLASDSFKLWAGGQELDRKSRREALGAALAAAKEGTAPPELQLDAVTFLQGDEPNRNHVRFKPAALGALGKSYRTAPFLKNHDSRDIAARGGTVLSSKLEKVDGVAQFPMRIELATDWAVIGALNGTIDRFSIGWSRTGPVECSLHKTPVFTECDCWPGDVLDGKVVEFVFTAAEGTEVSAVNVPAVLGTGIQSITQLEMLDRPALSYILGSTSTPARETKEKTTMIDPQILQALGLSPTATLADVLSAIGSNKDRITLAEAAKKTATDSLAELATAAAKRETEQRAVLIDASITQLVAAGKLKPGSEVEQALRRTGAREGGMDILAAQVKDMLATGAQVTPVSVTTPANTPDPVGAATALGASLDGKGFLAENPSTAGWLAKAGITQEQFERHGKVARATLAHQRANS